MEASVLVEDLDIAGIPVREAEDDAELIVDANAEEPRPVAAQLFPLIAARRAMVEEVMRGIQHVELSQCCRQGRFWQRTRILFIHSIRDFLSRLIGETPDHCHIVTS